MTGGCGREAAAGSTDRARGAWGGGGGAGGGAFGGEASEAIAGGAGARAAADGVLGAGGSGDSPTGAAAIVGKRPVVAVCGGCGVAVAKEEEGGGAMDGRAGLRSALSAGRSGAGGGGEGTGATGDDGIVAAWLRRGGGDVPRVLFWARGRIVCWGATIPLLKSSSTDQSIEALGKVGLGAGWLRAS